MQRLSIRLAFVLLTIAFTGFGLPKSPATMAPAAAVNTSPSGPSTAGQTKFYWFFYPDDFYDNFRSIPDESFALWIYYGVPVNSSPSGGTLVARGYPNANYPHNFLPSQFLYAHY